MGITELLHPQSETITAEELVTLVRVIPFEAAVKLVEQFGQMHQATGRLDHAVDVYNRVSVGMEGKSRA